MRKSMHVEEIEAGQYQVHSPSGKTYNVRYCGSGDSDPEFMGIWECDCPAAKYSHDGICKHIGAVVTTLDWDGGI
jgi:hypothetical protein